MPIQATETAMQTIAIIFTVLVALWGHRGATATLRDLRGSDGGSGIDRDRTPSPPVASG
jgi:hypothetical protein